MTSAFLPGPLVSICASFWQHSSAPDPSCWSPTVSKTGGKLPSPLTQPLLTPQCQQCAPSGPHASASLERGPAKSVPAPLLMPLGWRLAGAVLLTSDSATAPLSQVSSQTHHPLPSSDPSQKAGQSSRPIRGQPENPHCRHEQLWRMGGGPLRRAFSGRLSNTAGGQVSQGIFLEDRSPRVSKALERASPLIQQFPSQ